MSVELRITGADQLARLAKELKTAEPKLRRKLNKAIRTGVRPVVRETQQAIRGLPVRGTRGGGSRRRASHAFGRGASARAKRAEADEHEEGGAGRASLRDQRALAKARKGSGLRDSIARAIKVEIKTGSRSAAVRIVVDDKQLPPDQRSLPRHLDSAKGWKKPTFGHAPWTKQYGRPWFDVTIRKHAGELREQIVKAMDELAAELEKST